MVAPRTLALGTALMRVDPASACQVLVTSVNLVLVLIVFPSATSYWLLAKTFQLIALSFELPATSQYR